MQEGKLHFNGSTRRINESLHRPAFLAAAQRRMDLLGPQLARENIKGQRKINVIFMASPCKGVNGIFEALYMVPDMNCA